jgi:hypothetical protein
MLTASVVVAPKATGLDGGNRDTIFGKAGVIVTSVLALAPFNVALTWVFP